MKTFTFTLAFVIFGFLALANGSATISDAHQNYFDETRKRTYHHIEIYSVECGTITYDGYTDWDGHVPVSMCVDITSERCGSHVISFGTPPPADLFDSTGRVTNSSVRRFVYALYGLK